MNQDKSFFFQSRNNEGRMFGEITSQSRQLSHLQKEICSAAHDHPVSHVDVDFFVLLISFW